MAQAIALASLDFVMPDVQRIGGVTGWMRAAALAHAHGIEMSSHLFPEFSATSWGHADGTGWSSWTGPCRWQQPAEAGDGHVVIPDRPAQASRGTRRVERYLLA
jgi:mandelate racemase